MCSTEAIEQENVVFCPLPAQGSPPKICWRTEWQGLKKTCVACLICASVCLQIVAMFEKLEVKDATVKSSFIVCLFLCSGWKWLFHAPHSYSFLKKLLLFPHHHTHTKLSVLVVVGLFVILKALSTCQSLVSHGFLFFSTLTRQGLFFWTL